MVQNFKLSCMEKALTLTEKKRVDILAAAQGPSGNADLRKGEEADEIFRFIAFWKKQTGKKPPHLVFDSKLTTYTNLSKLNKMNITFVTLRRRTPNVLKDVANAPRSAWRKIELKNVERKYYPSPRTPGYLPFHKNLKWLIYSYPG